MTKKRFWTDPKESQDALAAWEWTEKEGKTREDGYYHFLNLGKARGQSYATRTLSSWRGRVHTLLRQPELIDNLEESDLDEIIRGLLLKEPQTLESLSTIVDRSKVSVRSALERLKAVGFEIRLDEETAVMDTSLRPTEWRIDLTPYYGESLKFGLISCTHFGSQWRQLKELQTFYKICEREKARLVLHAGDLIDGVNMYTGQRFGLYAHGSDAQADDVVQNYPKSNIPTLVLGGNHDFSFQKSSGENVVRRICGKRDDLEYVGMQSATFFLPGSDLEANLIHKRGGVPYARSYAAQVIVRNMPPDKMKSILGVGGLHVNDYLYYQDQDIFTIPCFQGQTPYLKAKGLFPEVGGWIIEVFLSVGGKIRRRKFELITFETAIGPVEKEI